MTVALIKTGADLLVLPAHPESCPPADGHTGMIHLVNQILCHYRGKHFLAVTEITKTDPLPPQMGNAGLCQSVPRAQVHLPVHLC